MKKLISIILLCSSCSVNKMHHKPSYKNSVKNIEVMIKWLDYDVYHGYIDESVANNYFYILEITQEGLNKSKKQRDDK